MNNFRIGNNISNMNNIDQFISNQGFMSERTKSPRRILPNNMAHNQFFESNEQNFNRINSGRDMSPNKLVNKNRPLLGNTVVMNPRIPHVQNNFHNNYHGSFIDNQNRITFDMKANQQNNNWKNIKSPRSPHQTHFFNNQHQNLPKKCANHQNKKAQYMTETEGEYIHYCETCAAKLAANNFEVIKLPVSGFNNQYSHSHKPKLQYQRREIPSVPEYKGNPIYQSIIEFLKEVFTVEHEHYEGYEELQRIDQHYARQIEMVDEFYRNLQDILSKMHQDHIADIQKEHKKHSQMKDIYLNDIHDNLESINEIIKDLEESFDTVVTEISKEHIQHFNSALDQNRIQIRFYKNKIEEQKETLNQIVSYKEERLSDMIGEFEKCLTTLWEEPQQVKPQNVAYQRNINQNKQVLNPPMRQPNVVHPQQHFNLNVPVSSGNNVLQPNNRQIQKPNDQKFNVMQIHQNSQKSGLTRDFEGKGACRQIFEDDDDENQLEQQVSPNFKNI